MRLDPSQLRWRCRRLNLKTGEQASIHYVQERASRAIAVGLELEGDGFNIFVVGKEGVGKKSLVLKMAEERVKKLPVPFDWCYLYNFKDPKSPKAVSLPAGTGAKLQEDMRNFIRYLKEEIPKSFESKEYEEKAKELTDIYTRKKDELIKQLTKMAEIAGFSIKYTPAGVMIMPLMGGQLIPEDKLRSDPKLREFVDMKRREIEPLVTEYLKKIREVDAEYYKKLKELREEFALRVINAGIEELYEKYRKYPEIESHIEDMKQDILKSLDLFLQQAGADNPFATIYIERNLSKYDVNVIVDNSKLKHAPLIYEKTPTYNNLFGKIGLRAEFGLYIADFNQIVAGSIHRANGGILILNVKDVLMNPGVWHTLKKVLKHKEIHIQPYLEELGFSHPISSLMRPQPIPLNLKVILLGEPILFALLSLLDPEFGDLFKIRAEFTEKTENSPNNRSLFASTLRQIEREKRLLPFSTKALKRLIEYSVRMAEDKEKLSLRLDKCVEVMEEASYYAKKRKANEVSEEDVERALKEKVFRWSLIREELLRLIKEGTLIVEPYGEAIGQAYGLAVIDTGNFSFGKPVRITATAGVGDKGVVSIEREVELAGTIFKKAVLTLSGYLNGKYGRDIPLSLSASISFEQSYSLIEGDSASVAELIALLSAIAEVPVKQNIAFTGSIDQLGNVQPVGGINEKIEGFYEVCKILNVKGEVVIPSRNIRNLQLEEEVVEAVRKGKFAVHAVSTVDEAIEIATGMGAKEFHSRVKKELEKLYRATRRKR